MRYNCSIKKVSPRATNTGDMRQPCWRFSMDNSISDTPRKQCYICREYYPETGDYFRPTRGCGIRSKFEPRCRFCHNAIRNKRLVLIYPNGTDKYKPCSRCHNFLLRSEFWKDNQRSDGLCSMCKECHAKQKGVKHHLVKVPVPDGMRYCRKGDKCVHPRGPVLPSTLDYFPVDKARSDGLHSYCKACNSARNKSYFDRNYFKIKKVGLLYRLRNKTKIAAKNKEWSRLNLQRKLINNQRRKARLNELPDTFTESDWNYAISYWNGCCATCGRPLNDLFGTHKAAMDHWIPLQSPDCPGTVAWNIVPLCHGIDGCNNRKRDTNPPEWVLQTFGKSKGKLILKAIDRYLALVREKS